MNKYLKLRILSKRSFGAIVGAMILTLTALFIPNVSRADTVPATIPLCEIQRPLTVGANGEDVRCLQRYLNWSGMTVATTGVGSPGFESTYFGPLTASAVTRWQIAHTAYVLSPAGLTTGTGYFGPISFGHYVSLVRTALGV